MIKNLLNHSDLNPLASDERNKRKILKICENDRILFSPILCLVERWDDIEILYLDDENFYIYDKLADCYNLYTHQDSVRHNIIRDMEKPLRIRIFDELSYKEVQKKFTFKYTEICREVAAEIELEYMDSILDICLASNEDLTRIQKCYREDFEPYYFQYAIDAKRFWISEYSNDKQALCMVGIHIDDSIGFLYIDKEYRRRGLGSEMAIYAINEALRIGLPIAFSEVDEHNNASLQMYKSIGCTISRTPVFWLFEECF